MGRKSVYTAEQKAEALAIYADHGPSVAAERTGIPKGTIAAWSNRTGTQTNQLENTKAANAQRLTDFATRRLELAHGLLDDIARLRAELFAPCVQRKAMNVSDGKDAGSHIEIIDIELDGPTFGDQARIMTSIGIAVDKTQLLTGQATERHETLGNSIDDELVRLAGELDLVPNGPA